MYNSIILSSCLFASVYLFSTSLSLLSTNVSFLENKKISEVSHQIPLKSTNEVLRILNSIILSSCLFGSVYLFSTSLSLLSTNVSFLENKKISEVSHQIPLKSTNEVLRILIIINGITFIISGSVFLYCITITKQ